MQKPVDEEIAQEAVRNYDGDKQQTVIQNVVVKATKEHLTKQLRLTATNEEEAWDAKKMKEFLNKTPDMTYKRNKSAQG